ncbi:MAG: TadE/TadG family type IV pilus assembly protein [Actinomycetota bacterium]
MRERGQATVEFAFCLPFVALLLAALFEVGMVLSDQVRLWHAAREAARVAVVDPDPAAARRAAEGVGLEDVVADVTPDRTGRRQGEPLTVSLTYQPTGRMPLIGELFERLQLRARATMRIEQP